jgi:hypothetical protein
MSHGRVSKSVIARDHGSRAERFAMASAALTKRDIRRSVSPLRRDLEVRDKLPHIRSRHGHVDAIDSGMIGRFGSIDGLRWPRYLPV